MPKSGWNVMNDSPTSAQNRFHESILAGK